MADHTHTWEPPRRTHAGWYVRCAHCDAWFATPGPDVPTAVPDWMAATGGAAVVPPPMQVRGQKVAADVIYPAEIPSNTIDARPPKPAPLSRAIPADPTAQSGEPEVRDA